jgi:hypothetical protein
MEEERGDLSFAAVANRLQEHLLWPVQQLSDAEAQADDTDLDAIVGSWTAVLREYVSGDDERDRDRRRCRIEETPPMEGTVGHTFPPGWDTDCRRDACHEQFSRPSWGGHVPLLAAS